MLPVCSCPPEETEIFPAERLMSQKSASGRASPTSSEAAGNSKGEWMIRSIRHSSLPPPAEAMKDVAAAADIAASIKAVAGTISVPKTTWSLRKASLGLLDNRASNLSTVLSPPVASEDLDVAELTEARCNRALGGGTIQR